MKVNAIFLTSNPTSFGASLNPKPGSEGQTKLKFSSSLDSFEGNMKKKEITSK
jgi:hypothetical protein